MPKIRPFSLKNRKNRPARELWGRIFDLKILAKGFP